MPKLAIQEDMLPGRTVHERLSNAKRLNLSGVEFWADEVTERVPEIASALEQTGLSACGINLGRIDGYLSPDLQTREQAIGAMRQAMADAVDLNAEYVSFVPLFGTSLMPDLTPYRTPIDLEKEMMIWLLRTVSDLAYAIGTQLLMQPINHYETHFMNRVEQAKYFRKKIKDHDHVKIAPNLFHMALEEDDINATLQVHQEDIGVIYLADSNRRLPGHGLIPFNSLGKTLKTMNYDGWLVLECGTPQHNHDLAYLYYDALPTCIEMMTKHAII
jgi:sugar phosphate isomerase/epimerase